jgi:hypothetical protein
VIKGDLMLLVGINGVEGLKGSEATGGGIDDGTDEVGFCDCVEGPWFIAGVTGDTFRSGWGGS